MDRASLDQKVEEVFQFALGCTQNHPKLSRLHLTLQECYAPLHQPMRLAIVGMIKAGKSTMMNALLGEDVVATGNVEATFNVNVLQYGEQKSLRIFYKDDRPPETKSFDDLRQITLRAEQNQDYLQSIKYIEVSYPNPILKTLNLIDTPGLESYFEKDQENTLAFLNLTEVTKSEASKADALLFLFDKSFSQSDRETLAQFQRSQANPINAIGILTKIDAYDQPINQAEKIIRDLPVKFPEISDRFYAILPVCGLLAFGAKTLTVDNFQVLIELAQIELKKLLKNPDRFIKEYDNPTIPPAYKRQVLLSKLGMYGINLACCLLRDRIVENLEDLTENLLECSGICKLQNLIQSHFGNRAFLIKLNNLLQTVKSTCFIERQNLDGSDYQLITDIERDFSELELSYKYAFDELRVLHLYYQNRLNFTEDEQNELLNIAGENGSSFSEKLGLTADSSYEVMIDRANQRIQYWSYRTNNIIGTDNQTFDAVEVILSSYSRILYRIQQNNS